METGRLRNREKSLFSIIYNLTRQIQNDLQYNELLRLNCKKQLNDYFLWFY